MKKMITLMSLLFSVSVFAADVKIIGFNYVSQNGPDAELCGVVTGAKTVPSFVKVLVDQHTNRATTYNTLAGQDGRFCLMLVTYRGRVSVGVMGEEQSIDAHIQ